MDIGTCDEDLQYIGTRKADTLKSRDKNVKNTTQTAQRKPGGRHQCVSKIRFLDFSLPFGTLSCELTQYCSHTDSMGHRHFYVSDIFECHPAQLTASQKRLLWSKRWFGHSDWCVFLDQSLNDLIWLNDFNSCLVVLCCVTNLSSLSYCLSLPPNSLSLKESVRQNIKFSSRTIAL